ncbi:hypothetical protein [Streptomyces tsukubensis]|uniref:Uncharacterized protein n=1 Tax=Streptomyces tsukubensis TaxID=83656 RepID=A0A1V4A3N8_9ACTN|nr:hypothetical protein [Streptomyces tsukubensis]OON74002.1 hypothetical protein B1H18_26170 [Streptomyces tsukubensis]QFR92952.1 hypothetical protein GBW32_07535 [Streptomyces tsukubensis]
MNIDWAALGSVFGVSLVVTVGLVGLFTLGIVGLSKVSSTSSRSAGTSAPAASSPAPAASPGGSAALARTGAYLCFGLCAAAVAYGIHLIVA